MLAGAAAGDVAGATTSCSTGSGAGASAGAGWGLGDGADPAGAVQSTSIPLRSWAQCLGFVLERQTAGTADRVHDQAAVGAATSSGEGVLLEPQLQQKIARTRCRHSSHCARRRTCWTRSWPRSGAR